MEGGIIAVNSKFTPISAALEKGTLLSIRTAHDTAWSGNSARSALYTHSEERPSCKDFFHCTFYSQMSLCFSFLKIPCVASVLQLQKSQITIIFHKQTKETLPSYNFLMGCNWCLQGKKMAKLHMEC